MSDKIKRLLEDEELMELLKRPVITEDDVNNYNNNAEKTRIKIRDKIYRDTFKKRHPAYKKRYYKGMEGILTGKRKKRTKQVPQYNPDGSLMTYYQRNKEEVKMKNLARYHAKKKLPK